MEGHRPRALGQTIDILLDLSEPGRWMAHCHIAELHESGMMFSFTVAAASPTSSRGVLAEEQPA
jgi:FtsP/CotA-like multicopper oxidase with cupredoxin domain